MISARLSDGTARKLMTGHPKYVLPQRFQLKCQLKRCRAATFAAPPALSPRSE